MKAEKRHELEQNELADWLGEQIEAVKPYAPTIGIVALGAIVAIVLAGYLLSSGPAASARAWSSYFAAATERDSEGRVTTLEAFAKEMPNSPASLWAIQAVGDIHLSQGAMQLFSDREEARKSLEKAEARFLQVEKEATNEMLKSRARLSLGKLYECLCKPDVAKKHYELVVSTERESAVGKYAKRAIERLSDPRDVELLAWFAEQKPRRPVPGLGPGGVPGMPNDLPERPDFSLPGLGSPPVETGSATGAATGTKSGRTAPTGLNLEGIGSGNPNDPSLEFPKPGETTAPVSDNPNATKPAEKPAERKPGETQPDATKPAEAKPE